MRLSDLAPFGQASCFDAQLPQGDLMRPLPFLALTLVLSSPALAFAQPGEPTPLTLDLKKVPVGAWSEYTMALGKGKDAMTVKSRWSLVARDANSNTLEMSAEGPPLEAMGGKSVVKMVLAPDPISSDHPVKQMVVQVGARDPMELPADMPSQRFQKPDPKKLVGKETVKVPAGTFKTSHYHDVNSTATVDYWTSDDAQPLGLVKLTSTPKPGALAPNGQPMPPVNLQLSAKGKDAKATITKPAKPFDPSAFGPPAGPPPSAPPSKK
jgi:hypothetical protein